MLGAVGERGDQHQPEGAARVAGLVAERRAVGVDVQVAELAVAQASADGVVASAQQRGQVEAEEEDLLVVDGLARVQHVVADLGAVDVELEGADARRVGAGAGDGLAFG